MAIKKTLLEIVQEILSDMDSEDVNSISDTLEADQVAQIVENTFYNIVATREIPEHYELMKLTALADTDYPTHFRYPDNVRRIDRVDYDVSDDGSFEYRTIEWRDPLVFLSLIDGISSDYDSVTDKNGGTNLRIRNNKQPQWFTSFDDYYIVMDSYDSSIDSTLQESKTRALGVKYPVFSKTDSYTPDLDADMFRYLINESKSVAQSLLKGGSDPKTEQAARRQKSYIQNDRYNSGNKRVWNDFGRRKP